MRLLLTALAGLVLATGSAFGQMVIPHEVLTEVANSVSKTTIHALQRRHSLTRIEARKFRFLGTTLYRWRIADRRPPDLVARELRGEDVVASAQPNYRFKLRRRPPPN